MNWTTLDTWIVLAGALICMACVLPGTFLMLNRDSMLGDGISHAVLPGLAAAFLITGSRDVLPMLIGGIVAGLLTAGLTQAVQKLGRVENGAALGTVFCALFALGLILIRTASDHVDLDPDCVLYGSIETAVVDVPGVPRVVWTAAALLLGNLFIVTLLYKELRLAAFDSALADTLGFSSTLLRLILTVSASVTTVMAFECVGSILVIAMLIVPAATASLLTRKLHHLILVALLIAALCAPLGHLSAIVLPGVVGRVLDLPFTLGATSSAAMMAAVAGGLFAAAAIVARFRRA